MNIVYMGTPDFAVTILDGLLQENHNIIKVYSQPDKPKGRGKKLHTPPVIEYAIEHNLDFAQPASINTEDFLLELKNLNPDVVIVAAYGKIIPKAALDIPNYGFINVHASLLPTYRGAAPIQWALRNGDKMTGVSIMQLEEGLDSGPVFMKREIAIDNAWNKAELFDVLAREGASLLNQTLNSIENGDLTAVPQCHEDATYAPMFEKNIEKIDFKLSSEEIFNIYRALMPDDAIFTFFRGKRLTFKEIEVAKDAIKNRGVPGEIVEINKHYIAIATGKGEILVKTLQFAGKNAVPCQAFINGYRPHVGELFENEVD